MQKLTETQIQNVETTYTHEREVNINPKLFELKIAPQNDI